MDATLPRVGGGAKRSSRPSIPGPHAELVLLALRRPFRTHSARFAARLGPLALAFGLAFGLARGAGAALSAQTPAAPGPATPAATTAAVTPAAAAGAALTADSLARAPAD